MTYGRAQSPTPDPAPPVPDAVIDAVLDASRALVAISARSIADNSSVTLPQFRMLVVLDGGSSNLSGLATALDVAPSTAMRMVDRLIDTGLVLREVPPDDRRQTVLRLTPRGRRTVRRVLTRRRRDLADVLTRIPAARRQRVAGALAEFARAAEAPPGPADATGPDRP